MEIAIIIGMIIIIFFLWEIALKSRAIIDKDGITTEYKMLEELKKINENIYNLQRDIKKNTPNNTSELKRIDETLWKIEWNVSRSSDYLSDIRKDIRNKLKN